MSQSNAIRMLIVDDDRDLRQSLARRFRRVGMQVREAESGEEALAHTAETRFDVALVDLYMPGMNGLELLGMLKEEQPSLEAIMLTAQGNIETAIEAMKRGAYDYLTKPFPLPDLEIHVQRAFEKSRLARSHRQWLAKIDYESSRYRLVGSSQAMREIYDLIRKVAPSNATVLVRGPSGTGKELVARALHYNSPRASRPLVAINCAAMQETLLESELFGHQKGAFTGALQDKRGLIEIAEGGTLFIDEIAEMAPSMQAKLLRVLEDRSYRRVGSTREVQADVRVVAATNRHLDEEMRAGRFREDLFYRLSVVEVEMPQLRDRREEIPELVEHFLSTRQVGATRKQIADDALRALQGYDWPGNVRELANLIERAQILASNGLITLDDFPDYVAASAPMTAVESANSLAGVQRRHVAQVLARVNGNYQQAAKNLGVSRRAVYRLVEKHGLSNDHKRGA